MGGGGWGRRGAGRSWWSRWPTSASPASRHTPLITPPASAPHLVRQAHTGLSENLLLPCAASRADPPQHLRSAATLRATPRPCGCWRAGRVGVGGPGRAGVCGDCVGVYGPARAGRSCGRCRVPRGTGCHVWSLCVVRVRVCAWSVCGGVNGACVVCVWGVRVWCVWAGHGAHHDGRHRHQPGPPNPRQGRLPPFPTPIPPPPPPPHPPPPRQT